MLASMGTPPAPAPEAPITSVQPGGGTIVALERGWGKLRRALLRRFRPGYVRRMAELRQGHCPGCTHDVVDPRDLKLYRNVCGYWFRPEDDRFAWRGRLGLARPGLAELLCATLVLVPLAGLGAVLAWWLHPVWWALTVVATAVWGFIVSFFRDPHRTISTDPDAVVSPADGTVTHVDEVDVPDFPGGRGLRVSIFLSVFNVHVNRVPRTARVTRLRYFPGRFLDARSKDCHMANEQLWVDFTDERLGCPLRVAQIAGAVARRIVCCLKLGETVAAGDRFGMIKFGSRTEVLVPPAVVAEVCVQVGDVVRGGSRVLLRLRSPSPGG
jgi:phosphatidylserine decarboxylase